MGERRSRKPPEAVGRTPATLHRWGITAGSGAAGRIKADMFGLDGTLTYEQDARGRLVPHVDISLLPTDPDEAALGYLAMMCDGATSKDDVGFGMSDASGGPSARSEDRPMGRNGPDRCPPHRVPSPQTTRRSRPCRSRA